VRKSWVVAVVGLAVVGCGGTPLVGGTGGAAGQSTDASTGTCTTVPVSAPDSGPESCTQLAADYAATLQAVLFCTPGAPHQCQGEAVTEAVCDDLCPYFQPVNDSTPTLVAYQRWAAQCGGVCNHIMCNGSFEPPGVCVAVDGGTATGGICVVETTRPGTGTGVTSGPDGGDTGAPDAGETCDQLMAGYALAVNAAIACTPGAPNQCGAAIDPMPDPCGICEGTQAANDATGLSALEQRWRAQCARNLSCSVSGCNPPPVPGTCVAVNGGGLPGGGICLNRPRDAGN
jgi:hypothetical protein